MVNIDSIHLIPVHYWHQCVFYIRRLTNVTGSSRSVNIYIADELAATVDIILNPSLKLMLPLGIFDEPK